VHVLRTLALRRGVALSAVTRELAGRLGIRHALIPMSDAPVRTRVLTARGVLRVPGLFRARPVSAARAGDFDLPAAARRSLQPPLARIMRSRKVRAVVICPSNPYVSVAPILSVPGIRAWIRQRDFPVVAVSPIVGGAALKGPAAKMMPRTRLRGNRARHRASLRRLSRRLGDRYADAKLQRAIEQEGKAVMVTDTVMQDRGKSRQLAQRLVSFARGLS